MNDEKTEVVVTDIEMPFWSMVVFMVKWAVASIPAFIFLATLSALVFSMFGSVSGGFYRF
jgi:hypothetical protein